MLTFGSSIFIYLFFAIRLKFILVASIWGAFFSLFSSKFPALFITKIGYLISLTLDHVCELAKVSGVPLANEAGTG